MHARRLIQTQTPLHALVVSYFVVFLIPIEFSINLGSVFITPTRLFLILVCFPVLIKTLSTRKLDMADYAIFMMVIWYTLANLIKEGGGAVEDVGQYFLEVIVSYCIALSCMQNLHQIRKWAFMLFSMITVLGVLAIIEAYSHYRFLHEIPEAITGVYYYISDDTRLNLLRASSTFEHPILYGLFCSSMLSLIWYTTTNGVSRVIKLLIVATATFFSLSSAALLVLVLQIMLIVAEWLSRSIKRRVMIFACMAAVLIVGIELTSNRGSIRLLSSYLAFNPHTAYYRLHQWDFSIDDVMRNPLFGTVGGTFTKPWWLSDSMDNHWMVMALRGGVPHLLFMWLCIATIAVKLYRKRKRNPGTELATICMAWILCTGALYLGAWTVNFFGKSLPIFVFFLGAGAAITRFDETKDDEQEQGQDAPERARQFSRFTPQRGKYAPGYSRAHSQT